MKDENDITIIRNDLETIKANLRELQKAKVLSNREKKAFLDQSPDHSDLKRDTHYLKTMRTCANTPASSLKR